MVQKGSRIPWNTSEGRIFGWPARSSPLHRPAEAIPSASRVGPGGLLGRDDTSKDSGACLPQAGYLWTQGRREPSLLPYLARPVSTHTSLAGSMTSRAGSGGAATSNQTDTNRRGSASGRQQRLRLGICVWDPCTAQWQVRKERRMGPLACLTGNTGPLWSLEWKLLTGGPERSSLWSTWLESSCYKKTSFKNGLIQSALAGWL